MAAMRPPAPLLDTHVWLWWLLGQPDLPTAERKALDALMASGRRPSVSAISLWEAQRLFAKGRLEVDMPLTRWLPIAAEAVEVMPLGVEEVLALDALPAAFDGDPADRLIVATARARPRAGNA